ncbi:SprT-like domain-containing protein [Arcobacter sp. LA11]|uniref:SprT-like domain-containing protein n=1 Tax=Arcobacter sp. LA11 TaxID=1898176 RepID=UPI0009336D9A|nr:SprT-like domain-containing protein [Arcobacter sp. LA11]
MFLKKLKIFFIIVVILGTLFLVYSWYKNYQFKNNPLNQNIVEKINKKHKELEILTYQKFNIKRKIPVTVSDKMPSKLYGAATFSKSGQIQIFLNKKYFQESLEYMIDDVLPHEYAHALMFVKGNTTNQKGGHTKEWQNICKSLNGLRCDRFVNIDDIIIGKTNFF